MQSEGCYYCIVERINENSSLSVATVLIHIYNTMNPSNSSYHTMPITEFDDNDIMNIYEGATFFWHINSADGVSKIQFEYGHNNDDKNSESIVQMMGFQVWN